MTGVISLKIEKIAADTCWYREILGLITVAFGQCCNARRIGIAERAPYFLAW